MDLLYLPPMEAASLAVKLEALALCLRELSALAPTLTREELRAELTQILTQLQELGASSCH